MGMVIAMDRRLLWDDDVLEDTQLLRWGEFRERQLRMDILKDLPCPIQQKDELLGSVIRYVLEVVEATGERTNDKCRILRERTLENVEANCTGVGNDQPWTVGSPGIVDDAGKDLFLEPAEYATIARIARAAHPEISV